MINMRWYVGTYGYDEKINGRTAVRPKEIKI